MLARMHNYPPGSVVQQRNGYIFVKLENGTWQAEARWVMENKVISRPLKSFERVYHRDGDRTNNERGNLVVLKINQTPFKVFERSRPLFIPARRVVKMAQAQ